MKYQPGQHFIISLWYDKNCFENMKKKTVTPPPFCIPQLVTCHQFTTREPVWVDLRKYALVLHATYCPVSYYRFLLVRFGSVRHDLINCLASDLLLCPFHKKLIIWEMSLGFCQTGNLRLSFIMYCYSTYLPVYMWRELTSRNREVSEFSFLLSWQSRVTAKAGLPTETPTGNGINPNGDAIYTDRYRLDR